MSFNEVMGIIAISCFVVAVLSIGVYYIMLSLKHSFEDNSVKYCNNFIYKVIYCYAGVSNSRLFSSLRQAVEFINILESKNTLDFYKITAIKSIH